MKATKVKAQVIGAVTAALLLTACTGGSDTPDSGSTAAADGAPTGTVVVNYGAFPENWSPGQEMEAGPLRIAYETLMTRDESGEVVPLLATDWELTDESLTLNLQEGVTFHDGTPFDAEAVKTNLELVRDGTTQFAGPLQSIESIDVVDDLSLTLNLTEPTPSLPTTLTTRVAPMGSPAAIADGSIAEAPVGTGPWAYDSDASTTGTQFTFSLYDEYWGGPEAVGVETIELVAIPDDQAAAGALLNGEIHITDTEESVLGQLEASPDVETFDYPAIRNNPLFFDRGPGGVFEDVNVRKAACYSMDLEQLQKVAPDTQIRDQFFNEGETGYDPDIEGYSTDLEQAQELMAAAGNPQVEGEALAAPFTEEQLQVYSDQWSEAGIQIGVQTVPPPQFFSSWNSGAYPIGLGSQDELTAYDWYKAWFAADAPANPSGVESPELKAAADAAIAAGDTDEAADLWGEVTRIIIDDEALTCGFSGSVEIIAFNTQFVSGVEAPSTPYEPNLVDYRKLRPASA